jgi:hypothetical protein
MDDGTVSVIDTRAYSKVADFPWFGMVLLEVYSGNRFYPAKERLFSLPAWENLPRAARRYPARRQICLSGTQAILLSRYRKDDSFRGVLLRLYSVRS